MKKHIYLFLLKFFFVFIPSISSQVFTLPNYEVSVKNNNLHNYYFLSPIKISSAGNSLPINLVLDENGEILLFKYFNKGPFAGSFKIHPSGTISYFHNGKFYILNKYFNLIDSVTCKNKIETDGHEFIILDNGNYLLIGTELVEMNLEGYPYFCKKNRPGSKRAKVTCNVIQELSKNKEVVFEWHAKDYYHFEDVDPYFLNDSSQVDWMHFNALDIDTDGNILISVRNFNEITKVNRSTGKIEWRLGGKKNQFKFINDSTGFYGQHDVRRTVSGTLSLFDNGRNNLNFHPEGAKEYRLDEKILQAELVWSYVNNQNACSSGYGSVSRLIDGNTLINYGRSDSANTLFNVVNSKGQKLIELTSSDSLRNYRAYAYTTVPFATTRPEVIIQKKKGKQYLITPGYSNCLWSNGIKASGIEITKSGTYRVYVPINEDIYVSSLPIEIQIE